MTMSNIRRLVGFCTKIRKELSILLGIALAVVLMQQSSFAKVCQQIRQDTLRLHIRAASDSVQDQEEKLAVRDAILQQAEELFANQTNRQQAEESVQQNLEQIQQVASDVLKSRGSDHTAQVYLTEMLFDTIEYEGFTMPAGEYHALRVDIGEAEGKNWWCVMFPPLCIPAAQPVEEVQCYSQQEKELLQGDYEIRFALVEWWQHLSAKTPSYDGC